MIMLYEENGKTYKIEDGRVVEAVASQSEREEEIEALVDEADEGDEKDEASENDEGKKVTVPLNISIGDPVEARGKKGQVISRTASVYGDALGVRFEDGTVGEYLEENLKRIAMDKIARGTPVEQLKADYDEYQKMADMTPEEIEEKEAAARSLNLRAKALVTDKHMALSDVIFLDSVVSGTAVDMLDLRESRDLIDQTKVASVEPVSWYGNHIAGSSDDASWLDTIEVEEHEVDEGQLAIHAQSVAAALPREELENAAFMRDAKAFAKSALLPADYERFENLLDEAVASRLAEPVAEPKTASTDEDIEDFDTQALYWSE